ncbi:MAG TPA: PQQ-dependent dehydrogenase, methanol/ethanol family, partial [Immundisolibacter sp.]
MPVLRTARTAQAAAVAAVLWVAAARAAGPTQADLLADADTTQDVVTYGMGLYVNRFSPLDQINASTVGKLAPGWTADLDDDRGQEAQPLVHDGVIYAITHKSTFAFDARTGKPLWRHDLSFEKRMARVVCCGMIARGAALYEGKLIRQTLDNRVLALDLKTGKEVWSVQAADWQDGYTMTGAPLVADGVVIAGVAGGDMGVRGFLDGYDASTGKKLWRFWTTAGPDDPAGKTWQGDAYLHGGGATWLPGSYDPKLDLVYWGIGNPGPWNATVRPGDNLYTDSVVALRPKTGQLVWHYQYTPNDTFDYDGVNELIQADLQIDGKTRQVILNANRNGFFYVIDRATGELLRANQYIDNQHWAAGLEPKTGRPILSDTAKAVLAGEQKVIWPSNIGGKNWGPASFNPNTGLVYLNGFELSMNYKL